MQVKFKKITPTATIPTKANPLDAGFDLVATSAVVSHDHTFFEYGAGLAIEIPAGHVGLIYPRSSVSRVQQVLCNSVAVIDAGYTGEIKLRYRMTWRGGWFEPQIYKVGDKIGQLVIMPIPNVEFVEVEELSESQRGANGFGSSGQ